MRVLLFLFVCIFLLSKPVQISCDVVSHLEHLSEINDAKTLEGLEKFSEAVHHSNNDPSSESSSSSSSESLPNHSSDIEQRINDQNPSMPPLPDDFLSPIQKSSSSDPSLPHSPSELIRRTAEHAKKLKEIRNDYYQRTAGLSGMEQKKAMVEHKKRLDEWKKEQNELIHSFKQSKTKQYGPRSGSEQGNQGGTSDSSNPLFDHSPEKSEMIKKKLEEKHQQFIQERQEQLKQFRTASPSTGDELLTESNQQKSTNTENKEEREDGNDHTNDDRHQNSDSERIKLLNDQSHLIKRIHEDSDSIPLKKDHGSHHDVDGAGEHRRRMMEEIAAGLRRKNILGGGGSRHHTETQREIIKERLEKYHEHAMNYKKEYQEKKKMRKTIPKDEL